MLIRRIYSELTLLCRQLLISANSVFRAHSVVGKNFPISYFLVFVSDCFQLSQIIQTFLLLQKALDTIVRNVMLNSVRASLQLY